MVGVLEKSTGEKDELSQRPVFKDEQVGKKNLQPVTSEVNAEDSKDNFIHDIYLDGQHKNEENTVLSSNVKQQEDPTTKPNVITMPELVSQELFPTYSEKQKTSQEELRVSKDAVDVMDIERIGPHTLAEYEKTEKLVLQEKKRNDVVLSGIEDRDPEDIVINLAGQAIFNKKKNWVKALHDIVEVKEQPIEVTKADKKTGGGREPRNQGQQLQSGVPLLTQIPSINRVVTPWERESVKDLVQDLDQGRHLPFETQMLMSGGTQRKQQRGKQRDHNEGTQRKQHGGTKMEQPGGTKREQHGGSQRGQHGWTQREQHGRIQGEQGGGTQQEPHRGTQREQPEVTQREHPQAVFPPGVSPLANLRWVEMAVDDKPVLTVERMEKNKESSVAKEVLVSVKNQRTGGVLVSEKRVHDVFKEIHDQFIETEAPRSSLVLGTEDNISKKKTQPKRDGKGSNGGLGRTLNQDQSIQIRTNHQFDMQMQIDDSAEISSKLDMMKKTRPLSHIDIAREKEKGEMQKKEGRRHKKIQMKHTESRWHKGKPKLPKKVKTSKDQMTKQKKGRRRKFGQRLNNKANDEEFHDVQKDERASLKISKVKTKNQVTNKVKHSHTDQETETNVSEEIPLLDDIKRNRNQTDKQSDNRMKSLEFDQRPEEVIRTNLKEEIDKIDYSGDISEKLKKNNDDSSLISSPVSEVISEKNMEIQEVTNKSGDKKKTNKRKKFIRYNLPYNNKNPRSKTRADKSFKDLNVKNSVAEWLARG